MKFSTFCGIWTLITRWSHKKRMDCYKHSNYYRVQYSQTLAPGVSQIQSNCGTYHESYESVMSQMVPVHLWSLSWVTCIHYESHGCSPPVFFIKSCMDLSWVRWIQSTCVLYQEWHRSVLRHMDPVHRSSLSRVTWICLESEESSPPVSFIKSHIDLSWDTWIQSTCLLYQESHGSVLNQMDRVHQWSISFVSPCYEPLSSVNSSVTISCSRTPLHGGVLRRCEADFVVNLLMLWDGVRVELWPLMGPSPHQMMFWVGREHCWSNKSYGTGELGGKTCVIFTFPTTNPTCTALKLNPDVCSEKPANMGLANDKAEDLSYSLHFEWRSLRKVYVLLVLSLHSYWPMFHCKSVQQVVVQ
jgi:hypothetical protein